MENTVSCISNQNAILFSIDIEAFESDQNIITEIPRKNQPEDGHIIPILHNYHLIVSEFFILRNKNYVNDVKDFYLLGESQIMSLDRCSYFIQFLINFYLFPGPREDNKWVRCLVGHGISHDLKWLTNMGIQLPNNLKDISTKHPRNISDNATYIIDTSKLH